MRFWMTRIRRGKKGQTASERGDSGQSSRAVEIFVLLCPLHVFLEPCTSQHGM